MKVDPRRILEEAAERRLSCELLPRTGARVRGTLVRVEKGGVVVSVPQRRFAGGEDLRVWLAVDGHRHTFEASVIRAGVPLPDRSQDGVMLGFIDRFTTDAQGGISSAIDAVLEVIPPNGPPLSLLRPPAAVVEVGVDGVAFTLPSDFTLIFLESGSVPVRLGVAGRTVEEVSARVRVLAPGEGYLLYALVFEEVHDVDLHREIIDVLRVGA
jgi:hypothetical protein